MFMNYSYFPKVLRGVLTYRLNENNCFKNYYKSNMHVYTRYVILTMELPFLRS